MCGLNGCRCLHMSKSMFEEGLGPLQAIIDRDRKARERVARQRRQRQVEVGLEVVSLADFASILTAPGEHGSAPSPNYPEGSACVRACAVEGLSSEADFGQWVLAKHSITGESYTLKAVIKEKAAEGGVSSQGLHRSLLVAARSTSFSSPCMATGRTRHERGAARGEAR